MSDMSDIGRLLPERRRSATTCPNSAPKVCSRRFRSPVLPPAAKSLLHLPRVPRSVRTHLCSPDRRAMSTLRRSSKLTHEKRSQLDHLYQRVAMISNGSSLPSVSRSQPLDSQREQRCDARNGLKRHCVTVNENTNRYRAISTSQSRHGDRGTRGDCARQMGFVSRREKAAQCVAHGYQTRQPAGGTRGGCGRLPHA